MQEVTFSRIHQLHPSNNVYVASGNCANTILGSATSGAPTVSTIFEPVHVTDLPYDEAELIGIGGSGFEVEPVQGIDAMANAQGEASHIDVDNGEERVQDDSENGPEDAVVPRGVGDGHADERSQNVETVGEKRGRASDDEGQQPAARKSRRVKKEPIEATIPAGQSQSAVSGINPHS